MNRFEFRAWDIDHKCFIYFSFADLESMDEFWNNHGLASNGVFKYQQFTGLKDIKNHKIYEGDIIKCSYHGISDVYWNGGYKIHGKYSAVSFGNGTSQGVEVIGNIYENPELLIIDT